MRCPSPSAARHPEPSEAGAYARGSFASMPNDLPLPTGTLDNARALLADLHAALAARPQDPRLTSAVGHAAAVVALLDLDPNPPHPHKSAEDT
jgi:hypothetical protein